MPLYKSKKVTVAGDVKSGDPGFDPAKKLVKIRHEDGREESVPRADVTEE